MKTSNSFAKTVSSESPENAVSAYSFVALIEYSNRLQVEIQNEITRYQMQFVQDTIAKGLELQSAKV